MSSLSCRNYIITIIGITFLLKISYLIIAGVEAKNNERPLPWTSMDKLYGVFLQNDGGWYKSIATNGYDFIPEQQHAAWKASHNFNHQSSYAFFPLYPMLMGGVMEITGSSFDAVAFWLGLILTIGCFLLAFNHFRWFWKSDYIAFIGTLVLMVFPFHYYFSMMYTEALFLGLLLASLWAARTNRWIILGLLTGALALVRPNGLLMLAPIFLFSIEVSQEQPRLNLRLFGRLFFSGVIVLALFGAYCTYLHYMTGDWFAFNTAQKGWDKVQGMPWDILTDPARINNWWILIEAYYTVIVIFISAWLTIDRKLPLSMILLVWVSLLLPLYAGSVVSMPRYISVLFPLFMYWAGWISAKPRWIIAILMILLVALQLRMFAYWVQGHPFSF